MGVQARNQTVKRHRYCSNCLARSHELRACPSPDACRICGKLHHTLLHPTIHSRLGTRQSRTPRKAGRTKTRKPTTRRPAVQESTTSSALPSRKQRSRTPPAVKSTSHTTSSGPNQRILSEAIRSLAEVLCVHPA